MYIQTYIYMFGSHRTAESKCVAHGFSSSSLKELVSESDLIPKRFFFSCKGKLLLGISIY